MTQQHTSTTRRGGGTVRCGNGEGRWAGGGRGGEANRHSPSAPPESALLRSSGRKRSGGRDEIMRGGDASIRFAYPMHGCPHRPTGGRHPCGRKGNGRATTTTPAYCRTSRGGGGGRHHRKWWWHTQCVKSAPIQHGDPPTAIPHGIARARTTPIRPPAQPRIAPSASAAARHRRRHTLSPRQFRTKQPLRGRGGGRRGRGEAPRPRPHPRMSEGGQLPTGVHRRGGRREWQHGLGSTGSAFSCTPSSSSSSAAARVYHFPSTPSGSRHSGRGRIEKGGGKEGSTVNKRACGSV